jgi:dTDP-glucose 4,6-dehydratase
LQRKKPLWIHGSGENVRAYLYAGDAADAFDTILHKGKVGQTYNVDSQDEISNLNLAAKLLKSFGINDVEGHIQRTRDRPFNDLRYAVDGTELRELGWKPKVSFEDGLRNTVEWYAQFSNWWGPIEGILSPFPVVRDELGEETTVEHEVRGFEKRVEVISQAESGAQARVKVEYNPDGVDGFDRFPVRNGVMKCTNGAGDHARKRKAGLTEEE